MTRQPSNESGASGGTGVPPVRGESASGGTGVPPVRGESASGGTGVPPVRGERITRRHLPHWQIENATYFLTWRCAEGVVLTEPERDAVLAAIHHWNGTRWHVFTAVVMPDHVHALAHSLPKGNGRWDLQDLIHSVKSYSAHQINKLRGRRGRVWQDERYDRWMRDEDEVAEKWDYIANNPVKAGLVERPEQYRWLYFWTGGTPVPPS